MLRGSSWQATAQLAPLLVNIVLTPVIITGLGVDRYGLFIFVNIIASVLATFDGGLGVAAQRYFALYAGAGDRASTTRLLRSITLLASGACALLFGAFFFIVPPVLALFQIPDALLPEGVFLLRTLVVIVGVATLRNVFAALINAEQRFAFTSLTLLAGYAVYITGVLVTVHNGWGLRAIAVTFVLQQLVTTLLIVPAALRLTVRARGLVPRAELIGFLRYGLQVMWASLMNLFSLQTDVLVVGAVFPVRQVGVYSSGANFALQMRNVPNNALAPLQSALGRVVGEQGPAAALPQFERLQRLWVVGTTGWGVVALAASSFGVTAWLGPAFTTSGTIAAVLLAGYLPVLWAGALMMWTQVLGHPGLAARCATVAAVLNAALTVALVVPFGLLGIVVATASTQVLSALLLLHLARRRLTHPGRGFLREVPVVAAAAAAVVVVALELLARPVVPSGALGLLVCGLLAAPGLVVYAVAALGPRRAWAAVRHPRGQLAGL